MKALNAKILTFVDAYLVNLNQSEAARKAGYSEKNARQTAVRLMRDARVKALIDERMKARSERVEIDQDRVLKEISRVAFGDPRKVMKWGPRGVKLIASSKLTDDEAAMVSETGQTISKDGGSLRLKLNDKLKALELLGRHLGMFRDKLEHSGPDGGPIAPPVINIGFANGGPGEPASSA